jgi:hypothetical protein
MNRTLFCLTLLPLLLLSCSLNPTVTVTIYNNTTVTSGTMSILYGDYTGYADGEITVTDPVFPYTTTISCTAKTASYIVEATITSSTYASSSGYVFLDTKSQSDTDVVINLEPYNVAGADTYEPDNSFNTGHPIQPGEWQARSIYPSSDADYVKFYATQGLAYEVDTVVPNNGSLYAVIVLYDTTGAQIKSVTGSYNRTTLTWTATYTGTCYIKVTSYNGYYCAYHLAIYEYTPGASLQYTLNKTNEWRFHTP